MKRTAIIMSLLLATAGCASSAGSQAGASSAGSQAGASSTCTQPSSGVTACVYPDGLHAIMYREANQFYWRPAKGYFSVAETFYKSSAPGLAAGAWSGRTISVGDSCVIDDNWLPNLTSPPMNCMDSRTGGSRGPTGEEQRSVLAFWRVMTKYVPSGER
jgi:hypothetical protein